MSIKLSKSKKVFIIVFIVIIFSISVTSGIMYFPRSIKNVLPDISDIDKIVKSEERVGEAELIIDEINLDENKYDQFLKLTNQIRYIRWYNLLQIKTQYYSSVRYIIYCKNGTEITITECYIAILYPDKNRERINFYKLTNNPFPEIDDLFI